MAWMLILALAVSSSLDNLGVGLSYGIRKIRISLFSNFLIAVVCLLFSYSGILFGKWISIVLPGVFPILLGTFILLVIGFRIILLSVPRKKQDHEETDPQTLGIGSILQNPERVDLDKSNHIGVLEALILGVALSTNALTNGLSAGLMGLSPLYISLTAAIGSFVTVWFGVWAGSKAANVRIGSFTLGQFGTLVSGVLLLLIAANNLF